MISCTLELVFPLAVGVEAELAELVVVGAAHWNILDVFQNTLNSCNNFGFFRYLETLISGKKTEK